ncbi:hypothetical protein [Agarivorans sp. QJM3NY_25]
MLFGISLNWQHWTGLLVQQRAAAEFIPPAEYEENYYRQLPDDQAA